MKKVVAERMTQFGQAGHAGDYAPIPLDEMAKRYGQRSGRRLTALADIDAAPARSAGGPRAAVGRLLVESAWTTLLDEDDLSAATRRGLLLAAAAGDPARGHRRRLPRRARDGRRPGGDRAWRRRLLAELRGLAGAGRRVCR